jgi:hypothetical protein
MRLMREYIQLTMLIGDFFKSYLSQSKSICTLFKNSRKIRQYNSVTILRYFLLNFKLIQYSKEFANILCFKCLQAAL